MTRPLQVFQQQKVNRFIMEALVDYILGSGLKRGDKLPSQAEMAQQMNVSATSLREAIARLEDRGILKQVQGVGTFVSSNPDEYKTTVSMDTSITEMITSMGKTPGTSETITEWRKLPPEFTDFSDGDREFICVQRTRTADGKPFAISISYIVTDRIQSPDEIQIHKHNESLLTFLEEYCGEAVTYFEDEIEIVFPEDDIARKLEVPPSEPIFKMVRREYNQNGNLTIMSSDYFNMKTLSIKVSRYRLLQEIENPTYQENFHK